MKALLTTTLFLTALTSLLASIDPFDVVIMTDPTSGTTVFRSTIPLKGDATIRLMNATGYEMYQGTVPGEEFFSKRFSADHLPTGKYLFTITDNKGRTLLPFSFEKDRVRYSPSKGSRQLFPAVKLGENNVLVVNYPANGGRPIAVELLADSGQSIFTDIVSADVATRKAYQLGKLSAGSYLLTVDQKKTRLLSEAITLR